MSLFVERQNLKLEVTIIILSAKFCFLIGDRYDSEPRGTDQFDEFNGKTTRKSKIREWRERAGSYGEYKDRER